MCCVRGHRLKSQLNRFGNFLIAYLARPARPQLVLQPLKSVLRKTPPRFANRIRIDIKPFAGVLVLKTIPPQAASCVRAAPDLVRCDAAQPIR